MAGQANFKIVESAGKPTPLQLVRGVNDTMDSQYVFAIVMVVAALLTHLV